MVKRVKKPTGVPLQDSMAYFVSTIRHLDAWWKENGAKSASIAFDSTNPFSKSSVSRSMDAEELVHFIAESELQINFLMKMPSIQRILTEWWNYFSQGQSEITALMLSSMYFSLGTVLIRAKKPNLQKSAVRTLMHCPWIQWNASSGPSLTATEYHRLIFLLGYMVVESDNLSDYVESLTQTLRLVQRQRAAGEEAKEKILLRKKTRASRTSLKLKKPSPECKSIDDNQLTSHFSVTMGSLVLSTNASLNNISSPIHCRKLADSSQVVCKDLSLLMPNFQLKFQPSCPPPQHAFAPPMHIQSIRSMNRSVQSFPLLKNLPPEDIVANSIDDIERLISTCTHTKPQIMPQILRRNLSRPTVLDRIQYENT
ncbi:hypothetical protein THRCLA_22615 [Thraustotheca clavata]|uniref:Uncharacterized protein n=1 Tax=Thraustotheca clavata TaxID=74557 RepID=A0A1V9YW12_9STRA|nr:hypothetical protein THRCLA_22615 [Thraustotheca clavata]